MNLKLVAAVDNYKPGEKGLAFGQPAHVLDAAEISHDCWDELAIETIVGCWRRSNCLPLNPTEPESTFCSGVDDSSQLVLEAAANEIANLIDSKYK